MPGEKIKARLENIKHIESAFSLMDKEKKALLQLCRPCGSSPSIRAALGKIQENFSLKESQLSHERDQIRALIASYPDEAAKNILVLRYLCGFPWWQISQDSNYSVESCHRLHRSALRQLESAR